MATATKPKAKPRTRTGAWTQKDDRLFTLDVLLLDGPMTKAFCKANRKVSRTIELRGDDTLDLLHEAIFTAFDRDDPHMYEFQIGGKEPMDHAARRYVLPIAMDDDLGFTIIAGSVETTPIGSVDLKEKDTFFYWFDFGDDWWHRITVTSIADKAPKGKYPKIIARRGVSPPQYVDWDEE